MSKSKQNEKGIYVGLPSPNGGESHSSTDEADLEVEAAFVEQKSLDDVRKAQAIQLLTTGNSVSETARIVGVHRSTIHRWLSDPDFSRVLAERRAEFIDQTFDLQLFASLQATRKLLQLMESDDQRMAFWSARTLLPLKDAFMRIDHERRVRSMEDVLDELRYL
jgi:hypothetical protein